MTVFECAIVGGSSGGLSAALSLGRSLRRVVVIDSGLPCNRHAPHSQNFFTRDGTPPSEILAIGKQQILDKYKTVDFVEGTVTSIKTSNEGTTFDVATSTGDCFQSKKVLFSPGVKDVFPEIPGFAECWGKSVIHCPYCHGYEYHSQDTAILVTKPPHAVHLAPILRNLTPSVKIISNGKDPTEIFSAEDLDRFEKNGIKVLSSSVTEIQHDGNGHLTTVVLNDGTYVPLKVLYASPAFELNGRNLMEELGCKFTDDGYLSVDNFQKTTVSGVFACGDCTTFFRSLSYSVNGGNIAGAMINMELSGEEFAAGRI
jgi:thioredoxin reductase